MPGFFYGLAIGGTFYLGLAMSDKLDVTIGISADASGVEAGVGKAKKSIHSLGGAARDMSAKVGSSGKAAGAGFEAMGAGSDKAAKAVERATRSMQQQLQRQIAELNAGGKATREYTEALARMRGVDTRALAPLLDQLDLARKKTDEATKATGGLASGLGSLKAIAATALAGLSAGAFVSEIAAITKETAKAAAEIERFSALSNTSAQEFQRLAAGANTVGISAEKMADIFKDVQDKVGDFVQTGGGGMADFFERVAPKVGVTAENFRKLSGKDALQLYVSSLEKANLAHSDMVFFMEAIASDSSLLLPLLKDQGQAWQELGDKAEAYGAVMDGQALAAAKAFKTESDNLELSLKGLRIELAEGLLPSMTQFVAVLSDSSTRSALSDLAGWIGDVAVSAVELSSVIGGAGVWGWLQTGNVEAKDAAAEIAKVEAQMAKVRETRDALERAGGGWLHAEDIAVANSQLSTMEAKLRGLRVMAQQYQAQQAAALKSMGRSVGLSWLESYAPEAERPQALSPAYSKPTQKSASLKAEESAYKSLAKSIADLLAQQNLEISTGEKLTSAQKLRLKVEQEVAKSKQAGLLAQIDEIEANEAWLKNTSDVEKALADMQKAREQSLRSVQESVRQMVEEAEAAAYAEVHNVSLAEAVERLALARAEDAYQQAVVRGESQQTLEALEKELQARKKIVELTAQKSAKEANDKAQEQLKRDWERTAQTIGDTLADYIMAGGKDAAQYLKRLFATLVLQPVVQTVVGGVMGVGAAGASGVAAGGAGGIANLVQQAYSAFTSPMFTNFGMGLAGNIQQLGGTLFGKGFEALGTSVTNFGNTVAQFSDAINMAGNIFGYGSALYSLSKGNYGSAIGTAAGTFLGGPIGAVLGSTLGGLLDGLFGGGRGANHSGGAYSTKGGNAAYQLGLGGDALRDFTSRGNASIANSVKGLVTTTVGAFDYLKKYSSTYKGVDVAAGFAVNPRYGDEDAYGYFRVLDKVSGKLLSSYAKRDGGLGSDTTKAWSTYSADLIKAVYGQFKKSDITGWVQDELAVLDSAASLENLTEAVKAIALIDAAFADFAKTVDGMQDLSGAVQTVLLRTSGGIEALSANVATYYQAFYSEQERAAKTSGQLAEALKEYGVELPTTAEHYRDLVEQQLAAGESGAELAAVLLGMSGTFKEVSDAWQRELEGLSGSVTSFFGSLKDAIKSLIDDVSDDRKSILRGTGVMTAEDLRAAIGAISVIGPSLGGVDAAAADIAAKEALRQSAKSASETAAQAAAAALARMEAYRDNPNSAAAQAKALEAQREHALSEARKFEDGGMYRSRSHRTRVKWMNYWYPEAQRAQQQLNALQPALAEYNDQLAALQAEYDAAKLSAEQYAERLGDAESALRAAQQAEVQAKADYAAEMAKWVEEAGVSVGKLSDLRGEVMSFYEAQAQAVQAMLASAGNIRAVVDAVRLNQLSAAQTAQELGARYAMDYSMALATTGTARAGYVDSMAGNLGVLSEALRSESLTSTDWRVQTAKLLAQANKAADLLEGDAQGDNYQDVALGLLDDIDAKLEALSGVATAGENLIVQAIKEGTVNTLDGLRAVVAALKGDPVPAFAAGGLHAGGLRLVGERGPELEVTGPARYWSTSQTAAMLGGGNSSAASEAMVRELRELRQENRALQEAMVRQQADMTRLLMRWETQGMPEERVV